MIMTLHWTGLGARLTLGVPVDVCANLSDLTRNKTTLASPLPIFRGETN